jgi:hypothetical protein
MRGNAVCLVTGFGAGFFAAFLVFGGFRHGYLN